MIVCPRIAPLCANQKERLISLLEPLNVELFSWSCRSARANNCVNEMRRPGSNEAVGCGGVGRVDAAMDIDHTLEGAVSL